MFEFTIPTRIEFGIDSLARLGHFAHTLGNRALVVAENVVSSSELNRSIESILKGKGIEAILYDAVFPNADSAVVDEIALFARSAKATIIIGVGGMRVCNIAKIAAFLARNNGDIFDYIHGREGNGDRVPYIEIPTTFREVYALVSSAYLTDAQDQANKVLALKGLGTDILINDPAIMNGMPLKTAVYVALDILSLCIEGYISMKVNPLVEPVLLRGVETVFYSLQQYIKNPHDVTIREQLCTAGLFTAIANIITGFGVGFALGMGMNGKNRKSKSVVSSILLPYVIDFNLSVSASRFAKIARVMGKDTSKKPETEAAFLAIEAIKEFHEALGIELHQRLRQLGLSKDDLAEAAEVAVRFEDINSVPRKASFEHLMAILEKAY
jgi:alcohol dehydrogenase class IV